MKRFLIVCTLGVLAARPSPASAQAAPAAPRASLTFDSRFAAFSPQRAFAESADGKAALARVTTLRTEKARAIDERQRALQAQEQALQQNSGVLSEPALTARRTQIERFRLDVQRFIEDAQAELMGVQRDAETAFLARLRPAVAKVAESKQLSIVFNLDDSIVWFDPALDITAEVVSALTQ